MQMTCNTSRGGGCSGGCYNVSEPGGGQGHNDSTKPSSEIKLSPCVGLKCEALPSNDPKYQRHESCGDGCQAGCTLCSSLADKSKPVGCGSCSSRCSTGCSGRCGGSCSSNCSSGCSGQCTNTCQGYCNKGCANNNFAESLELKKIMEIENMQELIERLQEEINRRSEKEDYKNDIDIEANINKLIELINNSFVKDIFFQTLEIIFEKFDIYFDHNNINITKKDDALQWIATLEQLRDTIVPLE